MINGSRGVGVFDIVFLDRACPELAGALSKAEGEAEWDNRIYRDIVNH